MSDFIRYCRALPAAVIDSMRSTVKNGSKDLHKDETRASRGIVASLKEAAGWKNSNSTKYDAATVATASGLLDAICSFSIS